MNALIIIDGFSTGKDLVEILHEKYKAHKIIHIITPSLINISKKLHYQIPTNNKKYECEYIYDNDYQKLINFLSSWIIVEITCGSESDGVILRDLLADYFKLPTRNSIDYTLCRRNKFHMGERLKESKLSNIKQLLISTNEELNNAIKEIKKFPVVLKPIDSGGSDGFTFCKDITEVELAFDNLLGKKNLFNKNNNELLIQEYINGNEYAVNAVSYKGKNYITDVWAYENVITADGRRICLSCSLEHDYDNNIINYIEKCLPALGYENGASHTEVMVNNEKVVLIESAARLMGGIPSSLLKDCLFTTQLELLATFMGEPGLLPTLKLGAKKHIKLVNIINNQEKGYLRKINDFNSIKSLSSFKDIIILAKVGQVVNKASSIEDCLARIVLLHDNADQITADYNYIRKVEKTFFDIH